MDYAYRYGDRRRLYLNATNRCANRCEFCIRYRANEFGAASLWGDGEGEEPDLEKLQDAVSRHGATAEVREFVWCGYGEPTFRLDLITEAAPWLRSFRDDVAIRLNTNGQACLIHRRDVMPELAAAVDAVSVSLNAPTAARYLELCRPDFSAFPRPQEVEARPGLVWDAVLDFLRRAPGHFKQVQASVVGFSLTAAEVEQSRSLAHSLGVERFRVR
ncbi:MAG: TatD family nuclease-associated radical SAM protein [Acidobacteriota bacterium]|jgi:TatD DNase family protein|nr:TatD family nuclease-associated radical SAM protein [Acidobacteriota bacterium]